MVELLERHGQGGPCSNERPGFTYDNSFLVADPSGAFVLETAGRQWACEQVSGPGRSISNGLTIPSFAKAHANPVRTWVAAASTRRSLTEPLACRATGPGRPDGGAAEPRSDGGTRLVPRPRRPGCPLRPCRGSGGLEPDHRLVGVRPPRGGPATGPPPPRRRAHRCSSRWPWTRPSTSGPPPTNVFDTGSPWWRHELLHRTTMRAYGTLIAPLPARPRSDRGQVDRRTAGHRRRPSPRPTGWSGGGWPTWPEPTSPTAVRHGSVGHGRPRPVPPVSTRSSPRDRHPGTRHRSRPVRPGRGPDAAHVGRGGAGARGPGEGRGPDRRRIHPGRDPGRARRPVARAHPEPHVRARRGAGPRDLPHLSTPASTWSSWGDGRPGWRRSGERYPSSTPSCSPTSSRA